MGYVQKNVLYATSWTLWALVGLLQFWCIHYVFACRVNASINNRPTALMLSVQRQVSILSADSHLMHSLQTLHPRPVVSVTLLVWTRMEKTHLIQRSLWSNVSTQQLNTLPSCLRKFGLNFFFLRHFWVLTSSVTVTLRVCYGLLPMLFDLHAYTFSLCF